MTVSTKGKSKSAVNLSMATMADLASGMAMVINPTDSATTLDRIRGIHPTTGEVSQSNATDLNVVINPTDSATTLDRIRGIHPTTGQVSQSNVTDLNVSLHTRVSKSSAESDSVACNDETHESTSDSQAPNNGCLSGDEDAPPTVRKVRTYSTVCNPSYREKGYPKELQQQSLFSTSSETCATQAADNSSLPNAETNSPTSATSESQDAHNSILSSDEAAPPTARKIHTNAHLLGRGNICLPIGEHSIPTSPIARSRSNREEANDDASSKPTEECNNNVTFDTTSPCLLDMRLEQMIPDTADCQSLERNPKWPNRQSMSGPTPEEVKDVRAVLGSVQLKYLRSLRTASERRPILAALHRMGFARAEIALATWIRITTHEWTKIGLHAMWPGPYVPVSKKAIHRLRVDLEILMKILRFLDSPGNLQQYAFGDVLRATFNDLAMVQLGKVDRLLTLRTLTEKFLKGLLSEIEYRHKHAIEEGDDVDRNRCTHVEKKSFCRCLQAKGHAGVHKYTEKTSISATTFKDLVGALTGGDAKRLSGLDDVKVEKGRENFIALKRLVEKVFNEQDKVMVFHKRIDKVELFYQTDFQKHLSRNGTHMCNCLTCGFVDTTNDCGIACNGQHLPSCTRCTESYKIIEEIQAAIKQKRDTALQSFKFDYKTLEKDKLEDLCSEKKLIKEGEVSVDIDVLVKKLESHDAKEPPVINWNGFKNAQLVAKLKELGMSRSGKNVVLVKRLQQYHEEESRYRVPFKLRKITSDERIKLDELEELVHEIEDRRADLTEYRSHLARHASEDAYAKKQLEELQDDECIVTADYKMKLLSCFFRENQKRWFGKRGTSLLGFMITRNSSDPDDRAKGIKDVRFVMMTTDDTLQDEAQVISAKAELYRHHLPEGIKKVHFTADGAGCFRSRLHRAVQPFWTAWAGVPELSYRITPAGDGKSALDGMFGRLNAVLATAVDQGGSHYDAESTVNAIEEGGGLAGTDFVQFEPDRQTKLSVEVSRSLDSVLLTILDPEEMSITAYKHSSYGNGMKVYPNDLKFSITPKDGEATLLSPYEDGKLLLDVVNSVTPKCSLYEAAKQTLKSRTSAKSSAPGAGPGAAGVRSDVAKNRVKKRVLQKQETQEDIRQQKRNAGIMLCDAQDQYGRYCQAEYCEKNRFYHAHLRSGNHRFPKGIRARDWLLHKVSQPGGMLAPGQRPDRGLRTLNEPLESAEGGSLGEDLARCQGKYNRKEGTVPYTKPEKLKEVLQKLYDKEPKLNAKQMFVEMKKMVDEEVGGLLFTYRKRFRTGMMLTESQIQGWISTATQNKKNEEKEKRGGKSETEIQEEAAIAQLRRTA